MIIDGKKIRDTILEEVKRGVEALPFVPIFCDILVGTDPVSSQYVRMKEKTAQSVGIKFRSAEFPESITTEELVLEIENLNRVPHMCGIIVQLPLPTHIDMHTVVNAILPSLDVDCLSEDAATLFYKNQNPLSFPAALACVAVLDSIEDTLIGKNIVVLGQGMLVGKPVTHLLKTRGLTVTTVDRTTEAKAAILKDADVIISGIGQGKFITSEMVKPGVIIIDAGTSEDTGGIVGDVDRSSVEQVASYLSPTPGGVGPVTVALLLKNVLTVAEHK